MDAAGLDPGGEHRIALRGKRLAAAGFEGPDVAHKHGSEISSKNGCQGATSPDNCAGLLLVSGAMTAKRRGRKNTGRFPRLRQMTSPARVLGELHGACL